MGVSYWAYPQSRRDQQKPEILSQTLKPVPRLGSQSLSVLERLRFRVTFDLVWILPRLDPEL